MPIKDLIPAYFLAVVEETRASARVAHIRSRIDEQARTEWRTHGSDRWKADGLGLSHVRLDGTQDGPRITVTKPDELASHLAQHAPDQVTVTVTVPAGELAAALDALEFAGVTVTESRAQPGPDAEVWVKENCRAVADPDTGGWVVQQRDPDGRVVTPDVPGLVAVRKVPRLVVSLDRDIKAQIEAEAIEEAEADLEDPTRPDVLPVVEASVPAVSVPQPRAAEPDPAQEQLLDGVPVSWFTVPQLRAHCHDAGLPTSGTKAELVARLTAHLHTATQGAPNA